MQGFVGTASDGRPRRYSTEVDEFMVADHAFAKTNLAGKRASTMTS